MNIPFSCNSGGCSASPVFNISPDKKRRFDSSLIIAVKKCRFNHVQVIICRPLSKKLRPFPTTFWLMCPHLIKLAGTVESQGGVNELEEFLRANNFYREWHEYNFLHQRIRLKLMNKNLCNFMRKFHGKIFKSLIRGGIGGTKYDYKNINVKCLHLQTASFLALGFSPCAEWLKSKKLCGDCEKNFCSRNL